MDEKFVWLVEYIVEHSMVESDGIEDKHTGAIVTEHLSIKDIEQQLYLALYGSDSLYKLVIKKAEYLGKALML